MNNFHDESSNNKNVGKVVYDMCKFHASGREDLVVRMLFKAPTTQIIGGRPFVCEITDVYRVPSKEDLEKLFMSMMELNKKNVFLEIIRRV